MAGFLSAAIAAIGSSSIGSALVRIMVAYGVSRLINGATGSQNDKTVDQGIRLQLQPNTTNPIPLLYGSAYYSGNITDAQLTNSNKTMWVCLTISEHTATNRLSDNSAVSTYIDEVYYNDQKVTFKADGITVDYVTNSDGTVDTNPRDLVKIYLYKNGSSQPVMPTGYTGTLPGDAYTLFPGWDSTWTMTNLTFALVKIDYNRDKGITGIPTLKFKVSNTLYKPGDALYDYMTNTVSGAALPASQIDTASLVALNDYADDEVNFYNEDTGTTLTLADRYQINGIINPQQNVLQNMQEIANSAGVYINYDITTGKWGVVVDRDVAALYHFDDSNILGGIDVSATSLDSMYNVVEAEFPSRLIQDQTDTIRITLPEEYLNANEPENVLNIRFTMLNEPVQARELAYLALYQNRQDRVVTFTTDYSKISVEAGDVITLTNSIYGFNNQTFRVIRVKEVESDLGDILVEIVAQEYDSTLYTAGGQPRRPRTPSAALNLPSLGIIATPNAPLVTTANNNRQPSILLTGTVPTGVVDRFEFWYSTDNWTTSFLIHEEKNSNGAPFNSSTTILARIATLPAGNYRFKVRAGNEQAYSAYSASTDELVWNPVQTTDAVTENTKFEVSDLLPILGAGAIAYFAYKALYPELVKALSNTDLGKLLGIEDPDQAALIADQLEQESSAFRLVTAGGVQMSPEVDNSLTFVAGDGINISVVSGTHDITISATGGAAAGVSSLNTKTGALTISAGTGINVSTSGSTITIENTCCGEDADPIPADLMPVDAGKIEELDVLDNCEAKITLPARSKKINVPAIPAVPNKWLYITGSGTYYDKCLKTTIPTLKISDPEKVLGLKVDPINWTDFTGFVTPTTTSIDWLPSYLNNKAVKIKRVSSTDYVIIKNWNTSTGAALPLNGDVCSITDAWSRPLFSTTRYPDGYEFLTYAMLDTVLEKEGSNYKFYFIKGSDEIPASVITKKYGTMERITVHARTCVKSYSKWIGYNAPTDFTGVISGNTLYTAAKIPLNSIITGTYTSATGTENIGSGVQVMSKSGTEYTLNTTFNDKMSTSESNYIAMKYRSPLTIAVSPEEELSLDYNVA